MSVFQWVFTFVKLPWNHSVLEKYSLKPYKTKLFLKGFCYSLFICSEIIFIPILRRKENEMQFSCS